MPDLGKAYVQIVPSAKGMTGGIKKELEGAGNESGGGFGAAFGAAAKKLIAAAAIGATIKKSLDAGGAMQQSFGGLDTLYEDAAEGAKKYAYEAAKAGISANSYAEQAVSFGASLKAAYGGDTQKAMEAANTAILDMADNAAKMGTPIENIQNAYQGFAKQNYTMLDNLKLGYGGTKTEMERLLKDAQDLTGVKYDINNLGDVYSAIHAIQENLHLTGVAAGEAKDTFTGSLGAMKASAENLLANLSLGKDITEPFKVMVESGKNFLVKNLAPMIGNIFKQLPTLLIGISDVGTELLKELLTGITDNAASMTETAKTLIVDLINGFTSNIALLITAGIEITKAVIQGLSEVNWIEVGKDILNALKEGIMSVSNTIFGKGATLDGVIADINAALPDILNKGIEIIDNVVTGIMSALPKILDTGGQIILSVGKGIVDALPIIFEKGGELINRLVTGISNGLPEIGTKAGEIIGKFGRYLVEHFPEILQKGQEMMGQLIAGIIKAIPKVLQALFNLGKSMAEQFDGINWLEIGVNIMNGIYEGFMSLVGTVGEAITSVCKSIWNAFTSFFQIASPSKKMKTGAIDIIKGIIEGLGATEWINKAVSAMTSLAGKVLGGFDPTKAKAKGTEILQNIKSGLEDSTVMQTVTAAAGTVMTTVSNALKLEKDNPFVAAGLGMGNAIATGIGNAAGAAVAAVRKVSEAASNEASAQAQAQRQASIDYAKTHAHINGSISAEAEMYGEVGDMSIIVDLLAQYLPAIAANDSYSINRINRELGYGMI